jgi:hypothetical protein
MITLLSGYLVLGYERTTRIDPGFNTEGLYFFQLDPVRDGYPVERVAELFERLPERFAGFGSVTFAKTAPLSDLVVTPGDRIAAQRNGEQILIAAVRHEIGPGYFATLGVPVLRGREFNVRDLQSASAAEAPAILNQAAARELFGESDPAGRRIRHDGRSYNVVGVVRDTKSALLMAKPAPTIYFPVNPAEGAVVLVRASGGADTAAGISRELAALDFRLTASNFRSFQEAMEQLNGLVRMSSVFYFSLGAFGLILASIGLAGITAHAVVRRRKEIGIRVALGARRTQVLRLVLAEGAALVGAGSLFGFAGAFGARQVLATTLDTMARAFDSSAGNPLLLFGVPLLLASLAMMACYIPARRSVRIDPVVVLREP